jgi:transglutaminase-like putative cysteine protease
MLFSISHNTKLNYSESISESVMEVRVMPRTDDRQVLRQFVLRVTPDAKACHHTDWLGNAVHQFSILNLHQKVVIVSNCIVETRPTRESLAELVAPLEGLIHDHRSRDFLQCHGQVNDDPTLAVLAEKIGLHKVRSVGEAIDIVTRCTRELIVYSPGATRSSSTVSDILRIGAGVCQDFTHLSLALLRQVGLPCRYVSGYLYKPGVPELQTHAWSEAFVPGVGWLAFDPTHAQLANESYVTVAIGRSYADVPPNRGVFRGAGKESLEVSVTMKPVDARARLTPYSTASDHPSVASTARATQLRSRVASSHEQSVTRSNTSVRVAQQQHQQPQ